MATLYSVQSRASDEQLADANTLVLVDKFANRPSVTFLFNVLLILQDHIVPVAQEPSNRI